MTSNLENINKLKSYLEKVKQGYGLTAQNKADIMLTFNRIHDKLFDKEFSFKTSEISQPPIRVSYHQLSNILFIYYLQTVKGVSLPASPPSAKVLIDQFEALKYNPDIINYLVWITGTFYRDFIKNAVASAKSAPKPGFSQFCQQYGVKSYGVAFDQLKWHNAINLVLLYGKYLDTASDAPSKHIIQFYRAFIGIQNQIADLLGKFSVADLYEIVPADKYSLWERSLYGNYYFRYMKYLSDFYDLGYTDLSAFFRKPQRFTYRLLNNHLLLTGFDKVNLVDNEYIISDTELLSSKKALVIHNILSRAGVTVKETLKRLGNNDIKDLVATYDPANLFTLTYNSSNRTFTILPVSGGTAATGTAAAMSSSRRVIKGGATVLEEIKTIRVQVAETVIKGSPKPKMILKVMLNDNFLYVFFRLDNEYKLMRRCDQRIIGSVSETRRANAMGEQLGDETVSYVKTEKMFPFEFVLFNLCCQALLSQFSKTLDNFSAKFFRRLQQTFKSSTVSNTNTNTVTVNKSGNGKVDQKCLYAYDGYPYLRQEYVGLHV